MKNLSKVILVIALVAIILGAGVSYWWFTRPEESSAKSVLTVGWSGAPTSLDPPNEKNNADITMQKLVHETLVVPLWAEGGFTIEPGLATSWEEVNTTCWRLHLRENVRFHDGTQFNAQAVKYNIDRLLDTSKQIAQAYLIQGFMDHAVVEDENTILFMLKGPSPIVMLTFTMGQLSMVSPTACENWGDAEYARHPVGTGPFVFSEWVESQYVKFVKNDEYWGETAKADEVIFKIVPDETTRFMSFLAGELDIINNFPPDRLSLIENNPKYELSKFPALRSVFFGLNVAKYPLDDLAVRQAIAYAVDRNSIVEFVLEGLATIATVPAPPGVPFRLPEEEYSVGGKYPYNVTRAKEILEQAGWVDTNGDGIVEKDGAPFEINLVSPSGRYLGDKSICEVMAEYMGDIGIKLNVQLLDVASWINRITTANFDMYLLGWGIPADIDAYLRRVWYTDPDLGRGVYSTYSNAVLDELVDKGVLETNDTARREIYYEAQRIIMNDVPMIPLCYSMSLVATSNAVEGFEVWANEVGVFDQAWVKTNT